MDALIKKLKTKQKNFDFHHNFQIFPFLKIFLIKLHTF